MIATHDEVFQNCIYGENTKFQDKMKLEAVDLSNQSKMHIATMLAFIKKIHSKILIKIFKTWFGRIFRVLQWAAHVEFFQKYIYSENAEFQDPT